MLGQQIITVFPLKLVAMYLIAEILLKVALSTISQNKSKSFKFKMVFTSVNVVCYMSNNVSVQIKCLN